MNTFDVAVGLDEATLNKALAQLFGHAGIQEKVARGQQKVPTPVGEIQISWELRAPPILSFQRPTPAQWQEAIKGLHDQELPAHNLFTLVCPDLWVGLEYADGKSESEALEVRLYAHLQVANGKVTVDPYGVWLDRSRLQKIQFDAFSALVFFGLEMAEKAVTDIALPEFPPELGVRIGQPVAEIDGQRLIVAAALSPRVVDLDGATWPAAGLFLLGSHDLVNGLVRSQLHRVDGQTFTWRREKLVTPGEGGAVVVEAAGEVLEVDVQVDAKALTHLGGTCRLAVRGSAVMSMLKALGLSTLQRILEKLHLSWFGLGYGAQILPSEVLFEVALVLEDRTVKVQIRNLRRCVALIWPRGSLPTMLMSLILWPLTQLAALIAPPLVASYLGSHRSTLDVWTITPVTFELLGKPLSLTVSGLGCSTSDDYLLLQSNLDLS